MMFSIHYNIQIENREAYYHSLVYVALKISMMDVQAEIQTALGRSDIVVSMDRYIYIIEFKMSSAQTALDQIEEKLRAGFEPAPTSPYLGKNSS